jgi:hypothetical protein
MKTIHHQRITEQALLRKVSGRALSTIISANIGQDALRYQIGHDHFHYDNNAFAGGNAYVDAQRAIIRPELEKHRPHKAWKAFGRLSHTVQDLYAHSNYVAIWLAENNEPHPDPDQIDPLAPEILADPGMRSGKTHYFFDALLSLNLLTPALLEFAPPNSHARLNIDSPDRANFEYVFSAAVKRTRIEFNRVITSLPEDLGKAFIDLG